MKPLKNIVLIKLLLVIAFLSCKNPTEKEKKTPLHISIDYKNNEPELYIDSIDFNAYNEIFILDTNTCKGFKNGRVVTRILKHKKTVLEGLGGESDIIYLRTTDSVNLWVCNFPKKITKKNLGDTLVVSALVYNIFGDEKVWGEPTVLTKILLQKLAYLKR